MKKLPIGIQNFEKIRLDGYFYLDKTEEIFNLISTGSYYFLSRPRRFGKSLLLSTIKAYYEGKRELFKGLAIDSLTDDWTPRPILYLDLNSRMYSEPNSLELELKKHLELWEQLYGDEYKDRAIEERFYHIVAKACRQTGHRVVILVDEYDKPMLQAIGNESLQEAYRDTLKAFYSVLKTQDEFIKFAMLTGVTKFGKVSVFSDLNNLMDISMDARYHDICGVNQQELEENFSEDIAELAAAQGMTCGECGQELRRMYDGYHFKENTPGLYNPFSLFNTFAKGEFGSYWFETGTPTYLVKLLKLHKYELNEMASMVTSGDVLNSVDAASTDPIPVIYQSGYLTIKGYDRRFKNYTLGFPNEEGGGERVREVPHAVLHAGEREQVGVRDKQLRERGGKRRHRRLLHQAQGLLRRNTIRAAARHRGALPERALHRIPPHGILHRGGVQDGGGPGRPRAQDRQVHIRDGVQAQRHGRAGHRADKREGLR